MLVLDVAYKCGITTLRYDVTLFGVLCLMLFLDEIWQKTDPASTFTAQFSDTHSSIVEGSR